MGVGLELVRILLGAGRLRKRYGAVLPRGRRGRRDLTLRSRPALKDGRPRYPGWYRWRPGQRLRSGLEALLSLGLVLSLSVCSPSDSLLETTDNSTPVWKIGTVGREFSGAVGVGGDSTFLYPVTQVSVLPDGRLAFGMSRGEAALVLVDTTGALVVARGEQGDGPGQFRSVSGLYTNAERIVVWDGRLRRLTSFDGDGELAGSTVRVPTEAGEAPLGFDSLGTFWTVAPERTPAPTEVVLHGWMGSFSAPTKLALDYVTRPPLSAPASVRGGLGNGFIVLNSLSGTCLPTTLFSWLGA